MAAGTLDIRIEQGTSFQQTLTFNDEAGEPIDVSTWIFAGQIRATYSSSSVIKPFVFIPGGDTNQVIMSMTAANTALIPVDPTNNFKIKPTYYCYDIIVTKLDMTVDRILEGAAIIIPTVTR